MDAATRLLALQGQRDYILFQMRDLEHEQTGLHPTLEKRKLMAYFEQLNAKIDELVIEVMADEGDLRSVVGNREIEDIEEGYIKQGYYYNEKNEILSLRNDEGRKFIFIYLKEQSDEEV